MCTVYVYIYMYVLFIYHIYYYSNNPHKTAFEIAKRIVNRINTGSNQMNPCPIS